MGIQYSRQGDTITFATTVPSALPVVGTCPQYQSTLVPNVTPDPKAPSTKCTKCLYKGEG